MSKSKAKLKIKKALESYGVTQYELAKRLDLQTQHVTKMVKADYNPTFKTLVRIADAIGCPVRELVDE